MNDILFILEPEGALRCNECMEWVDDAESHARDEHGSTIFTVVHYDD